MDDRQNAVNITNGVQPLLAGNHTVVTNDYVRSLKTFLAASKAAPCFAIFARSLLASRSNRTVILLHSGTYGVATRLEGWLATITARMRFVGPGMSLVSM